MIAIHKNGGGFTERWVSYCKKESIPYQLVNCWSNEWIREAQNYEAVLWHYRHYTYKEKVFAQNILNVLDMMGVTVFPNLRTGWHFDDKVSQKYLLESVDAEMVRTYVFYDKKEALNWLSNTAFPKVFKLKGGAGSSNVALVKTYSQGKKLIAKAFGQGFPQFDRRENLREKVRNFNWSKQWAKSFLLALYRLVFSTNFSNKYCREYGYVYFQNFIPQNSFDHRIIVIGDKAFGIQRNVRPNDFRASGSGETLYDPSFINQEALQISFETADKLKSQCVAFDFVYDKNRPLIVEISYAYTPLGYDKCPGYWQRDLTFIEGEFDPYGWIIENLRNEKV